MRALLLAQPHEPTDELLEALEDAEIHEVLRVQDWGAFLRIADSESPDVAVITGGSVSDGSALDSAHWALRGMNLPAFIAIFDDTPPEQISSVFPAVQMPFSSVEIMIAIEEAQEALAAGPPPNAASFGEPPRSQTTAENDVVPQELFAAAEGAESIVSQAIHSIMGLEADLDTDVGAPQGAFSLADSFGSGFNRPPSDFKPTLETDAATRADSTPTLETDATGRPDFKPTVEADVGSLFGPDDEYGSDAADEFDEEPSSISLNAVPDEHGPFDELGLGSDTGFDELDAELMAELNRQPVRGPLDPPPHPDDSDYLPEMEAQDLIDNEADDEAPPDEQEEVPEGSPRREERVVKLPDLRTGTLKETPLGVVFFALHVAEANGLLRVSKGQLSREIWVREGKLGRADRMPSTSDTDKLLGMFNWSDGVFTFDAQASVPNRIYRYEHPVELVYRGIAGHVGFNEVAVHFTPRFKQFIVRTTTDLDPVNVPAMRAVRPWLTSIDEPLAFERVMATAGADTEQVLKHAFFSECCGLITFVDDPSVSEVHLTFDTSAFASATAAPGPPPSGQYSPPRSGQYSPPSGQFESPAARAAREEAELRKDLEARAARLRRANPVRSPRPRSRLRAQGRRSRVLSARQEEPPGRLRRAIRPRHP